MPSRRSRAFCRAVSEETGGRLARWASIASVAERQAVDPEEAEALAAELHDAGLVRLGGGHSVILEEAGRRLAKDAANYIARLRFRPSVKLLAELLDKITIDIRKEKVT